MSNTAPVYHCQVVQTWICAVGNASHDNSCNTVSLLSKLFRDGHKSVMVCHNPWANAYPSPVDPV